MNIYDFVVSFMGPIPEQFEFVYTIITTILSIMILGAFTSLYYFVIKLVKGVI